MPRQSSSTVRLLPFDVPTVADTGAGIPPYADRGAYEYQDQPPRAALRISDHSGRAPVTLTADGSASTDDVGIVSYTFDFGDGTQVTQATAMASHTYTTAGRYFVVLTVRDGAGFTASDRKHVNVRPARGTTESATRRR